MRKITEQLIGNLTGRLQAASAIVDQTRTAIAQAAIPSMYQEAEKLSRRLSEAQSALVLAINEIQKFPIEVDSLAKVEKVA